MFVSKKKFKQLEKDIENLKKEFQEQSVKLYDILEKINDTQTLIAEKLVNQDKLNMMFYEYFDRGINNDTYH